MADSELRLINVISYYALCFFFISFVVFLAATQPFVMTEILGVSKGIGGQIGTLAFADEIVNIILSPLWGALSDKIGTRLVASFCTILTGIALIVYTTASDVYPQEFFLRVFFAIGASGAASMLTAILAEISSSSLTFGIIKHNTEAEPRDARSSGDGLLDDDSTAVFAEAVAENVPPKRNAKMASLVGISTVLGAVFAVSFFLPLPTMLDPDQKNPAKALKSAYYIVGSIACAVGVGLFLGLHRDRTKSFGKWITGRSTSILEEAALNISPTSSTSYLEDLLAGFTAAKDSSVALAYLGSGVSHATTICTSMFIPLFINDWFHRQGLCTVVSHGSDDVKTGCHDAYILSAMISGIAQLISLFFAPVWGYVGDKYGRRLSSLVAASIGVAGSFGFAFVSNPRSAQAYITAILICIGQIGTIIISMSMCTDTARSYNGAIAGVYSLCSGIGILVQSQVGGWLFDFWSGSPFILLGIANAVLILATAWVLWGPPRSPAIRLE